MARVSPTRLNSRMLARCSQSCTNARKPQKSQSVLQSFISQMRLMKRFFIEQISMKSLALFLQLVLCLRSQMWRTLILNTLYVLLLATPKDTGDALLCDHHPLFNPSPLVFPPPKVPLNHRKVFLPPPPNTFFSVISQENHREPCDISATWNLIPKCLLNQKFLRKTLLQFACSHGFWGPFRLDGNLRKLSPGTAAGIANRAQNKQMDG